MCLNLPGVPRPHTAPEVQGCLDAIDQTISLIEGATEFDLVRRTAPFSSVAAHFRHSFEHFECFINGVELGVIDYDARGRSSRLEESVTALKSALDGIQEALRMLCVCDLDRDLEIKQSPCAGVAGEPLRSTMRRELVFLASHQLHHLALAKLTLALAGVATDPRLGVAWSTVNAGKPTGG